MINDFLERVGIAHPILQAPMIGVKTALTAAVTAAGGLGSLACATMTPDELLIAVDAIRAVTNGPFNLNFFCHRPTARDADREMAWCHALRPYYFEFDLDPNVLPAIVKRAPFDRLMCETVIEEARPRVVSFHFGLPDAALVGRLQSAGILVFSSATTVAEARWLADLGVDAIIAQGYEAGGHRGMFLTDDLSTQSGLVALLPQIIDAVPLPVIAAGGIADGRGVAAAFALGAAAAQIGTAYLFCPEAGVSRPHLEALENATVDATALTNLFTGRPARGIVNRVMRDLGHMSSLPPAFPDAATALHPLRKAAEANGTGDFSPLWSGQSAGLARPLPAAELTRKLSLDTRAILRDCSRAMEDQDVRTS